MTVIEHIPFLFLLFCGAYVAGVTWRSKDRIDSAEKRIKELEPRHARHVLITTNHEVRIKRMEDKQ